MKTDTLSDLRLSWNYAFCPQPGLQAWLREEKPPRGPSLQDYVTEREPRERYVLPQTRVGKNKREKKHLSPALRGASSIKKRTLELVCGRLVWLYLVERNIEGKKRRNNKILGWQVLVSVRWPLRPRGFTWDNSTVSLYVCTFDTIHKYISPIFPVSWPFVI